jgi:hypothetical protein
MLLLIRTRYPSLATVLGVIFAIAFIGLGVCTGHTLWLVSGVVSLGLSAARISKGRRAGQAGA